MLGKYIHKPKLRTFFHQGLMSMYLICVYRVTLLSLSRKGSKVKVLTLVSLFSVGSCAKS